MSKLFCVLTIEMRGVVNVGQQEVWVVSKPLHPQFKYSECNILVLHWKAFLASLINQTTVTVP